MNAVGLEFATIQNSIHAAVKWTLQTDIRLVFAQNMKQLVNDDGINVKQLFFFAEANVCLHGHINKKNYRFWAHKNPHITEMKELKTRKFTVSCALSASQTFTPIFIEENITGDVYQNLLQFEFLPLCKKNNSFVDFWFVQDGATIHGTKPVFSLLKKTFHRRVLGLGYPSKFRLDAFPSSY